jgi:hypothetical protein
VGTAASPIDAKLSALGNYGGPTATHMLLVGSPAIDAGDLSAAVDADGAPLAIDQRGRNRVEYSIDIGAVEHEVLGDYNGNGVVDSADYVLWRDALGSTTNLIADGDGSGQVDDNDYEIWRDHYGHTAGPGLAASYGIFIVSTNVDESDGNYAAGDLSLREALSLAAGHAGADQIVFRRELSGQTITLSSGLGTLSINSQVELAGRGADQLTVSGGGAVRVFSVASGVTAEIRDVRITGGYTTSTGGGVYSEGNLTVTRAAIEGNASIAGGAIHAGAGSLMVADTTIADNSAVYVGGGVYYSSTPVTITNSTISTNSAGYYGGGIYGYGATLQLNHVTMTQNRIGSEYYVGGGLYVQSGQAILNHSLIADNFKGTGTVEDDVYGAVDTVLSRFNLIGTGGSGGLTNGSNGNLVGVANPGLTSLANHGGHTRTHALLDGSAAIDAGDASISGAPSGDQRGKTRIADGNDDLLARIDIGAFELAADEYFGSI